MDQFSISSAIQVDVGLYRFKVSDVVLIWQAVVVEGDGVAADILTVPSQLPLPSQALTKIKENLR